MSSTKCTSSKIANSRADRVSCGHGWVGGGVLAGQGRGGRRAGHTLGMLLAYSTSPAKQNSVCLPSGHAHPLARARQLYKLAHLAGAGMASLPDRATSVPNFVTVPFCVTRKKEQFRRIWQNSARFAAWHTDCSFFLAKPHRAEGELCANVDITHGLPRQRKTSSGYAGTVAYQRPNNRHSARRLGR